MFLIGERVTKGTFRVKEHCSECESADIEILVDKVVFECANKLKALGLISFEKDHTKNVTCEFGQEIGLLRDYFAAAYIVCKDKRIFDIAKLNLNIRLDDILPTIAFMLFSEDIFTKAFLEMLDNDECKTNLSKVQFYKDVMKLTADKLTFNEDEGVFRVREHIFGYKVARNLSRCAFESQAKCFDYFESSEKCEYKLDLLPEFGLSQPMVYFSWIQNLQSFSIAKISTMEMLENLAKSLKFCEQLSQHEIGKGPVFKVSLMAILASPEENKIDTEISTLTSLMKSQRAKIVKLDLSYRNDIWKQAEEEEKQEQIHAFLICSLTSVEILDLTGCQITILRPCNAEIENENKQGSKLKELILRNSTLSNFRESIPGSFLFANVHTVDITNSSIFLSKTSFEKMILLDHILKRKMVTKECKIRNIVTDLADEYALKYKHLGVNITRGPFDHLRSFLDTDLPDDTVVDSCLSRLRKILSCSKTEERSIFSPAFSDLQSNYNGGFSTPESTNILETSV
eukprot:GFUD01031527.1.p1 GENE.GFUD01031527.1~~GFUD01031527.1.p1  ORF type:complete len:544 (-),score=101.53 GFUD01031527.1:129-1670(-)